MEKIAELMVGLSMGISNIRSDSIEPKMLIGVGPIGLI